MEFNQVARKNNEVSVSIEVLRGQAMQRLAGIERRLGMMGINPATIHSGGDDMGILGAMIIGSLLGHVIGHAIEAKLGTLSEAFNGIPFGSGMEALLAMHDDTAGGYYRRRLNDYPEGRRNCALYAASKAKRKFNLVSANQNERLSYDARAEMACMHEIIDMLGRLEKQGVTDISLEDRAGAYNALRNMCKTMSRKGTVRGFGAAVQIKVA